MKERYKIEIENNLSFKSLENTLRDLFEKIGGYFIFKLKKSGNLE